MRACVLAESYQSFVFIFSLSFKRKMLAVSPRKVGLDNRVRKNKTTSTLETVSFWAGSCDEDNTVTTTERRARVLSSKTQLFFFFRLYLLQFFFPRRGGGGPLSSALYQKKLIYIYADWPITLLREFQKSVQVLSKEKKKKNTRAHSGAN